MPMPATDCLIECMLWESAPLPQSGINHRSSLTSWAPGCSEDIWKEELASLEVHTGTDESLQFKHKLPTEMLISWILVYLSISLVSHSYKFKSSTVRCFRSFLLKLRRINSEGCNSNSLKCIDTSLCVCIILWLGICHILSWCMFWHLPYTML